MKRDGSSEAYRVQNQSNGRRVYIGDADYFLPPGFYQYELRYLTTRQLGLFEDFDELYWNVTGNGWSFPIDKASATGSYRWLTTHRLYRAPGFHRAGTDTPPRGRRSGLF